MEYLKINLEEINANIERACARAGRSRDEVTLIGVTKTIDEPAINASIQYGVTDIAENKVQEITRKYDNIHKGVKWHLIGHLQTNKVKYIIDKVDLIHSLDSFKLAEEIDKRAAQHGKVMEVLIQINVVDEESKFGIPRSEVMSLLEEVSKLQHIKVAGLMNIAPFYDDPEMARRDFKVMKQLFDTLKDTTFDNVEMKYLSMGMTGDYEVAVEEGANLLRVGTGIYGARDYSK
ncbi:MAG: YggS family pyridoxal phosphate-dependent enzyme [Clostridia bacterium]|nr:YggS family pyridoxal phosphate-dependent enzyme [Clostridia bacterium]